jgi:tetratricopeptide (TPR) repeat protein
MRTRLFAIAALVAVVLLSPIGNVEACGPFFEDDVFVSTTGPDDIAAFARGQLGILQAGFDSNEYAVAYRYLNGGKLSDAELAFYAPAISRPQIVTDYRNLSPEQIAAAQKAEKEAQENAQPFGQWLKERAQYIPEGAPGEQKPVFPTNYDGTISLDEGYLNCPDPAFQNAMLTLTKRADTWGKKSPQLIDWIYGQDSVFSNCTGKTAVIPTPAPDDSPVLLRADRAYQIASAAFYAKQFDEAIRQFAAIAADGSSPWAAWGPYLAARATVRKAFAMGKTTNPYSGDLASYDADTMLRAQQMLESILQQPNLRLSRSIIQDELNFVRIRTEPEQRAKEIGIALAGPAPDPNFANDIRDLNWLLLKQVKTSNPPPLLSWIAAWRGGATGATAYATWQQSHALPWLVMAIVKADASDPFASELINEAAEIPPDAHAYDTVFFHRVRLLTALKRTDEARALLDAAIPPLQRQKPSSNLNALLGERMAVARNFKEFLIYAPRATLKTESQGSYDLHGQCNERARAVNRDADCPELKQPQFNEDAVTVLNRNTPIDLLIEAATSPSMPANLRQNIAVAAWTRTILLQDSASAAKLSPSLPKEIRDTAGSSTAFPASLAILRNPGIRPYLETGIPRVASYSYFDNLRNNWWCKPWGQSQYSGEAKPMPVPNVGFLPADALSRADSEYQQLQQLPDSVVVIGQRVLDYAKAHPDDANIPEALALVVRAGHYACQPYSGTDKSEYTPVSKAAFELLHRRYPKSPWALKTRFYY